MNLLPRNSIDFDRFFDNFFAPSTLGGDRSSFFTPKVDIHDNKDHYTIVAELPGVKKEDINIQLQDGVLTLEAQAHQENKEEAEGKVIRQERSYGKLTRSFNLGSNVQQGDISANFKDGLLTIKAPKVEQSEPEAKRIPIG
ncbi:Heat shock protein 16 [Saliniradius amylolyticus]|uniref:Heat shock protein 16 n=1 Tax=Saliniradius amylolyticus TaxID=2183582 RepID=A0A2S2E8N2_9ALTE|nr:Hsp20/alpha crystallin family protein [Saliniradius amylolyticus]AWL13287.1 Heat shock protein 16 [Saliniradius amylolyticus]